MYQAEIITIGDEILSGKTIDTNSAFIAQSLKNMGFEIAQISSISDAKDAIVCTLNQALSRSQVVVVTGGLGPTNDDITKYVLSDYFGLKIESDEFLLERLKSFYERRGRKLESANFGQADFPKGARYLLNDRGTATGMGFEKEGQWVFSMPGVPYEMEQMMRTSVTEIIQEHFQLESLVTKDIQTIGIPEAKMAEELADLELEKEADMNVAYLPKLGRVTLRLYLKPNMTDERLDSIISKIQSKIGAFIYDLNGSDIMEVVGQMLNDQSKKVAVAESCTGGYLGHLITSVAGSSNYFEGGVVSYSNEIKASQLDVQPSTLEKYGAVSEETVKEMAENVRSKFNVDFGLAISGVAGPGGGSEEKPVGTVCFAVASKSETIVRRYTFYKVRAVNIELSAIHALRLLWKYFLNNSQN